MKTNLNTKLASLTLALSFVTCFGFTAVAGATDAAPAATGRATTSEATATTSETSTTVPANVQAIIKAGDAKIAARFKTLDALTAKIAATTKLSAANKAALTAEVASAKAGLTALKTKLDADTTLATAKADERLILTDYRVYMLVAPKVHILKVADNQLTKEASLTVFANLLKTKAATSSQASTLVPQVDDMIAKIAAATKLTQNVEDKVLPLKPSDYNSNHALLVQYLKDLKTAQTTNVAAYQEGMAVAKALGQL